MKKQRKKYAHKKPPHKYLGSLNRQLTPTARELYDLIWFFGLGGCYMSNETISEKIECSTRSIRRARGLLTKLGLILAIRANPSTFKQWAKTHPAVRAAEKILYGKGYVFDNPFFDQNFAEEKKRRAKKR